MKLPGGCLNSMLSTPSMPVLLIEAIECRDGTAFRLVFESAEPRWRQGVWLAVEGDLEIAGQVTSQAVVWRDTAPRSHCTKPEAHLTIRLRRTVASLPAEGCACRPAGRRPAGGEGARSQTATLGRASQLSRTMERGSARQRFGATFCAPAKGGKASLH